MDQVTKKEIEIIYCPTCNMIAYLLTKPLRDNIMNVQDGA